MCDSDISYQGVVIPSVLSQPACAQSSMSWSSERTGRCAAPRRGACASSSGAGPLCTCRCKLLGFLLSEPPASWSHRVLRAGDQYANRAFVRAESIDCFAILARLTVDTAKAAADTAMSDHECAHIEARVNVTLAQPLLVFVRKWSDGHAARGRYIANAKQRELGVSYACQWCNSKVCPPKVRQSCDPNPFEILSHGALDVASAPRGDAGRFVYDSRTVVAHAYI